MKNENKIKVLGELTNKQEVIQKIVNLVENEKMLGVFLVKTGVEDKPYEIRVLSKTIHVIFYCDNAGVAITCGKELAADLGTTFKQIP